MIPQKGSVVYKQFKQCFNFYEYSAHININWHIIHVCLNDTSSIFLLIVRFFLKELNINRILMFWHI